MNIPRAHRLLLASAAIAFAACGTVPQPPTEALQAADIAVTTAENDKASEYAPLEMKTAREKLAAAHANLKDLDDDKVMRLRRLADESRADAQLASAKAHLAKADAVNAELQKNSDTLRREVDRKSGV